MMLKFESLPDEVLMIIFRYSGDAVSILHSFLGLNHRCNQILLDKRLHLLTDFVRTSKRDHYYPSKLFRHISHELSLVNAPLEPDELSRRLQPLISFHIQQRYIQLGDEVANALARVEIVRQRHSNTEQDRADRELYDLISQLGSTSLTKDVVDRVKRLIYVDGGRLDCDPYELTGFNLCKAVNNLLLAFINEPSAKSPFELRLRTEMFKHLFISNPDNLTNRDYVGNGGCGLHYFIIHSLYRLCSFYSAGTAPREPNIPCYRATIELFLCLLQCQRQTLGDAFDCRSILFDIISLMPQVNENLFIRTVQWEIFRIVADEHASQHHQPFDGNDNHWICRILQCLTAARRADVLDYLCRDRVMRGVLQETENIHIMVRGMTSSAMGRQFFSQLLRVESLGWLRSSTTLLFMLLDKKERTLLMQLLTDTPELLHAVDENGNDCLLRICLNVSGCRHRIIAQLLRMGSDVGRRNSAGQNFRDALQAPRNRKLLRQLIEHEIV